MSRPTTAPTPDHLASTKDPTPVSLWIKRLGVALILATTCCALPAAHPVFAANSVPSPLGVVRVQHDAPTNPAHQAAHERIRGDATFARASQAFAAFRLPRELSFRTRSCGGRRGAWYYEGAVTICYEYLQDIIDNAADPSRPDWVSQEAAIAGPIADVVLHEGAHALFEFFRTPLLGREEDAADMVSTYAILTFFGAEAGDLVRGVAYSYLVDAKARNFTDLPTLENRVLPSRAYGGAHSTPLQRLFSVVCHAAGFDPSAYQDLVERSGLPHWRASGCEDEFKQISFAVGQLLAPHLDTAALLQRFPQARLPER